MNGKNISSVPTFFINMLYLREIHLLMGFLLKIRSLLWYPILWPLISCTLNEKQGIKLERFNKRIMKFKSLVKYNKKEASIEAHT